MSYTPQRERERERERAYLTCLSAFMMCNVLFMTPHMCLAPGLLLHQYNLVYIPTPEQLFNMHKHCRSKCIPTLLYYLLPIPNMKSQRRLNTLTKLLRRINLNINPPLIWFPNSMDTFGHFIVPLFHHWPLGDSQFCTLH
jgi:hypothetical protein